VNAVSDKDFAAFGFAAMREARVTVALEISRHLLRRAHAIASPFPLLAAGILFLITSQAADLSASEETALAGESPTGVIGAGFLLIGLPREASGQCGASFLPVRSRP